MGKSSGAGGSSQTTTRGYAPRMRNLGSILERSLLGQMVEPPETAISVPQQQALSNLQGGFGQLARSFGVGGGGPMLPGANQWGLQSREQMGLPSRRSYFTFLPTKEQVAQLGAVPPILTQPQAVGGKRLGRLTERAAALEARGRTGRAGKVRERIERIKARQPEL